MITINPGLKVGGWKLGRQLGVGGMAEVWFGKNPKHPRPEQQQVAIKIFNLPIGGDTQSELDRFSREYNIAGKLIGYPEFVQTYSFHLLSLKNQDGSDLILPAIVMEYISWPTLGSELADLGTFSTDKSILIIKNICGAMQISHYEKIYHRDLKPSNIFIAPDGQVKISDFGTALLPSEFSTITRTGTLGTPGYAPQEQYLAGTKPAPALDIHPLGVMFFELLHGRIDFNQIGTPFLSQALDRGRLFWNPAFQNSPIENIIRNAVAYFPEDRYQTIAAMLEEIKICEESLSATSPISVQVLPGSLVTAPLTKKLPFLPAAAPAKVISISPAGEINKGTLKHRAFRGPRFMAVDQQSGKIFMLQETNQALRCGHSRDSFLVLSPAGGLDKVTTLKLNSLMLSTMGEPHDYFSLAVDSRRSILWLYCVCWGCGGNVKVGFLPISLKDGSVLQNEAQYINEFEPRIPGRIEVFNVDPSTGDFVYADDGVVAKITALRQLVFQIPKSFSQSMPFKIKHVFDFEVDDWGNTLVSAEITTIQKTGYSTDKKNYHCVMKFDPQGDCLFEMNPFNLNNFIPGLPVPSNYLSNGGDWGDGSRVCSDSFGNIFLYTVPDNLSVLDPFGQLIYKYRLPFTKSHGSTRSKPMLVQRDPQTGIGDILLISDPREAKVHRFKINY